MPDSAPATFRIATRGSALALAQADQVLGRCRNEFPHAEFQVVIIKTTGDKLQTASLADAGLPKGLFTKELESALLAGAADLAVHSLKDLPTELPAGLQLGGVLPRADVRDVLVYRHIESIACPTAIAKPVRQDRRGFKPELSIASLPRGAIVATSSTRRAAQVRECRPDVIIVPIRGNVGTRLAKFNDQSDLDALLLAAAGLDRLGIQSAPGECLSGADVPSGLAATRLSLGEMLPCVGQAAIGIEIRSNDTRVMEICARLNHPETLASVTAERAFLAAMGGGCQLPVAAHAKIVGDEIQMRAVSFLAEQARRHEARAPVREPDQLGAELASKLR